MSDPLTALLRETLEQINLLQAIVIALVVGLMTPSATALPASALAAVLVHVLADMFIPVAAENADPVMPQLDAPEFWIGAAVLFAGYFLAVGLIVLLRVAVDKG